MIHTWSKIRDKLENDYLADSLKKRIKYFATSYSKYPDLDGLDLIPETKQRAKMLTISDPAP